MYDVVIVGGGIVGLATAVGLFRRGNLENILVLEKGMKLHPVGAAIGMFPNGLRALQYLSPAVGAKVESACIDVDFMTTKDLEGRVVRESQTKVKYLVWYLLQQYLAEDLPENVVKVGHVVQSFQVDGDVVRVQVLNRDTEEIFELQTKALIGADGIHSTIRTQLFGPIEKNYHGKIMFRAVLPTSSLTNPPTRGTSVSFRGNEPGKLLAYRETAPGIFTVTAMARFDQPDCQTTPQRRKEKMIKEVFADYPAEVHALLEAIPAESIYENAVFDIEVMPQWSEGPVVLLGDAAHAMTPGLGQGANQGLEDACVLVSELVPALQSLEEKGEDTIGAAFERCWKDRMERVRMVHRASRSQTATVNRSSVSNPLTLDNLKEILEEINSWDAPQK